MFSMVRGKNLTFYTALENNTILLRPTFFRFRGDISSLGKITVKISRWFKLKDDLDLCFTFNPDERPVNVIMCTKVLNKDA